MATAEALIGLGFSAQAADLLGANPSTLTTTGTSQGTAAKILTRLVELSTASSQTGAILPAGYSVGVPFTVFTSASTTGVVYAPSGEYLNGTQNGSLSIAQNKAAIFVQYKKGYWCSILTA